MKTKISKTQEAIAHFGEGKNNQIKFYVLIAISMIVFSAFVASVISSKKKSNKFYNSKGVNITNLSQSKDPEGEWIAKSEEQLQNLRKELISFRSEKLSQDNEIKNIKNEYAAKISILEKKLNERKSVKSNLVDDKAKSPLSSEQLKKYDYKTGSYPSNDWNQDFVQREGNINAEQSSESKGIESFDFYSGEKKNKTKFDLSSYLPAGSYAKARLLSSVDASVGIQSQTDPRPVLFRVTSKAFTSKFKNENQSIDIEGCTVTGAASGDISSEKVYIRLLKMTCSDQENKVVETSVSGYAAALGKAGIRGPVISREGDYLVKAFFAGIVNGFGEGVSSRFMPDTSFVNGVTSQKQSTKDIIGQGLGRGTSNSAERLEDYLINRAEQYQPVISIPAGIDVELVFIDGVHLDGTIKAPPTVGINDNNVNTIGK